MRKFRRMISVVYARKKTRILHNLKWAMTEASKHIENEMLSQFLSHCAVFIQKHIRRHQQTRRYKQMLVAKTRIAGLV